MTLDKPIDFAEFLCRRGLITREVCDEIRRTVEMGSAPIGRLLVLMGLISLRDVVRILEVRRTEPEVRFGEIAVREGLVTQEQLTAALRKQWSAPRSQPEIIRERKLLDDETWTKALLEYVSFLEDTVAARNA